MMHLFVIFYKKASRPTDDLYHRKQFSIAIVMQQMIVAIMKG